MVVRRSLRVARRHKLAVGIFAALGLMAGLSYTAFNPPMRTSSAVVVLSPSVRHGPHVLWLARSDPVLTRANRSIRPAGSLDTLRSHIQVTSLAYNVVTISAERTTAALAERTANAVAGSYVSYIDAGKALGSAVQAHVLQEATRATGTPLAPRLFDTAGLGVLLGALIGTGLMSAQPRLRAVP